MIDLHTHTTASDGILEPEELIDLAADSSVRALAIADHDSVDALPMAERYSPSRGVKVVPSVELSIKHEGGTFHLLGMFIDYTDERLTESLKRLSQKRANRAQLIVEDLQRHGIKISIEEVMKEASGGALGRPHVARALIANGYGRSIADIFANFMEEGLPGYVPKEKLSFDEAMSLIKGAGGISILAHPATLNLPDKDAMRSFIKDLASKGLSGIETYSNMHDPEQTAFFLELAERQGLLVSGGSDFHGDKGEILGCYRNGLPVPDELYEPIEKFYKKTLLQKPKPSDLK